MEQKNYCGNCEGCSKKCNSMPKISFDGIDFSKFRKLEYPIPSEYVSVDRQCVVQPGKSDLSKASDAILNAMDKQKNIFPD